MAFMIVQTRKTKKSKPVLTIVPSKWVLEGHVWWPPNNFISLSTDESTVPDYATWTKQVCKVVGRAKGYKQAEDEVNRLQSVTDSEDAVNMTQGTRSHPAKKKVKFASKLYSLEPPKKQALLATIPMTENITVSGPMNENHAITPILNESSHNLKITPILKETSLSLRILSAGSLEPITEQQENSSQQEHLTEQTNSILTNNTQKTIMLQSSDRVTVANVSPSTAVDAVNGVSLQDAIRTTSASLINQSTNMVISHGNSIQSALSTFTPEDPEAPGINPKVAHTPEHLPENEINDAMQPTTPNKIIQVADGQKFLEIGYDCFVELPGEPQTVSEATTKNDEIEGCAPDELQQNNDCSAAMGLQLLNQIEGCVTGEMQHNDDCCTTTCEQLKELRSETVTVNSRLDRVEAKVDKLLLFMANIEKFMSMKHSGKSSSEMKRDPENFSEYTALFPISNEDLMVALETQLTTEAFADKLFRFFHTEYCLNGKREGSPFFKAILRRMVAPTVFRPFSWKGHSRKVPGPEDMVENRSFKDTFPRFVSFIQRIVCAADIEFTAEANQACFGKLLRQKNVEIQRFMEGKQSRQAICTRERKNHSVKIENSAGSNLECPEMAE